MSFNLDSLKKATASLQRAILVLSDVKFNNSLNKDQRQTLQAGIIQNFEFTYEIAWKTIKRWLEDNISENYATEIPRPEFFRRTAQNLLIDDVEKWIDYHKAINQTSRLYDEEVAAEVYIRACEFIRDAKKLIENLETKQ